MMRKILSVFLSAVIMVGFMCVENVSANAATVSGNYSIKADYYQNKKDSPFNDTYFIEIDINGGPIGSFTSKKLEGKRITVHYFCENETFTYVIDLEENNYQVAIYSDAKHYEDIAKFTGVTEFSEYFTLDDYINLMGQEQYENLLQTMFLGEFNPTWVTTSSGFVRPDSCISIHAKSEKFIEELKSCYLVTLSCGDKDGKNMVLEEVRFELKSPPNKTKDISSLSFSKISDKAYTGKAIKPSVTVKDGDTKLKKGTDYTVSYKNNKNIGTASVTIKGKGNYTGSKTIDFKIVPAKTTLKASKQSDTKVKLTWDKVKNAEKYQIYYSANGGKYKKLATVSGSKTSYTNSKLDFKKNDYKFKIRAYDKVDGTTYYGSYSKAVTVK